MTAAGRGRVGAGAYVPPLPHFYCNGGNYSTAWAVTDPLAESFEETTIFPVSASACPVKTTTPKATTLNLAGGGSGELNAVEHGSQKRVSTTGSCIFGGSGPGLTRQGSQSSNTRKVLTLENIYF